MPAACSAAFWFSLLQQCKPSSAVKKSADYMETQIRHSVWNRRRRVAGVCAGREKVKPVCKNKNGVINKTHRAMLLLPLDGSLFRGRLFFR